MSSNQGAFASAERARHAALLALVFASGFSGLVYQLVFLKLSVLVFGATVDAVSTVVAAFVAGLAAGSVWAGKLADRTRFPLLLYGLFEGAVGIVCIGLPLYFQALSVAYATAVRVLPESGSWTLFLRVGLAGVVVFVPTFLMGASLPLISRHSIDRRQGASSSTFSGIYGSNTLGAAIGILSATYVLVPRWGVERTLALAVGLNLFVALGAGLLHRMTAAVGARVAFDATATPPASSPAGRPLTAPAILLVAFFSGYLVFSLEVVWTHLLHLTVGGTAYVVGAILFVVLLGLGAGSVALAPLLRRGFDARSLLALALALTGLSVAVHLPIWNGLGDAFIPLGRLGLGFVGRELSRFALIAGAVFIPALLLGTIFPLTVGMALGDRTKVGQSIGRIYAANSAGSIVGPLVAGFFILPNVGSEWTLRAHAIVYAGLAVPIAWTFWKSKRLISIATLGLVAITFVVAFVSPRWDPRPLTSGANVYFGRGFRDYDRLLYFKESVHGGVTTVVEKSGAKILLTNGKFQGTNGPEAFFQINMGLVPMTLLSKTDRALNIGLGTGHTLATMALAPFKRIDVAEIAPEIVAAAREHFPDLHRGVFTDPRVHIEYVDGRNFLLIHPEARYDLIAVQVSSIWIAGAASLYNREFYELCRSRMSSGGVLQQWMTIHHMRQEDLVAVMATMADVFPHVSLWEFAHQAILLGSNQPLVGDYQRALAMEDRFRKAGVLDGFSTKRIFSVFAHHHLSNDGVRAFLDDVIPADKRRDFVSRDLHPLLEYGTPRGLTETDSVALFYRNTAPYSFAPLGEILRGIPADEHPRILEIIEQERSGAPVVHRLDR